MRFLPRYSLRLAWIALTIFLIVFGVSVNYYQRYQAHEQIALQFQNMNCNIEEEPLTLFGVWIGKRLTGIEITPQHGNAGYADFNQLKHLELLEKLPRPRDLRRLGVKAGGMEAADLVQIFAALPQYSELEELHLAGLDFTPAQLEVICALPQLRVLQLASCDFLPGQLKLLEKAPKLEQLILHHTQLELAELFQLNLPRLNNVMLYHLEMLTELNLTNQGWGHFPNLETLIIREHQIALINAEAGALPRLKNLDLGAVADFYEIDWPAVAAALPALEFIAVPTKWITPEGLASLARCANLAYVFLEDEFDQPYGRSSIQEFEPLDLVKYPYTVPERLLPAAQAFLQQRPHVQFTTDYSAVYQKFRPWDMSVGPGGDLWSSLHWRPTPQRQANFF
jgi:hypothetical protein